MTSAPPPPSMVSLPEPVVMVLAPDEPVTIRAELSAEASTFSKLVTLTVSPVVWSTPAGAVDGVVAGTAGDGVGRRRTGDGQRRRQRRTIDVLEVGDVGGIAGGLVGIAEVDDGRRLQDQRIGAGATVDVSFRAVIGD